MSLNRESTITILRSTGTDTPVGLTFGELAYSDMNKKLFVGKADGSSLWVGSEVTGGAIGNNPYLVPTQSAVKSYVEGYIGSGSVVNTFNGTGGDITLSGDGGAITNTSSGKGNTVAVRLATTGVTGVASFSSNNFNVATGEVSIKAGGITNGALANNTISGVQLGQNLNALTIGTGLGGGSYNGSADVTIANTGVLSLNGLTGARTLTGDGGAISGVSNDTIAARLASTSLTGVASFSSDNFAVDSNGLVTIKGGGVVNEELQYSSVAINGQTVSLGGSLTITGTAGEVDVSAGGNVITIGLPNDVTISGNLTVNGSVVTTNVENFVVEDPLLMLGTGNSGDSVDLGFYAKFVNGGTKYTGLFRDQDNGKYRLFTDLTEEPSATVNTSGTGYSVATLVARIDGGTF